MKKKYTDYPNVAWIYAPKNRDPYTGIWETNYFVPAIINQRGKQVNYIVVTCSPTWNGMWAYTPKEYGIWHNEGLPCYYVPIKDCRLHKRLEEITDPEVRERIKDMQKKWYKGEVKNQRAYKGDEPDWFLK